MMVYPTNPGSGGASGSPDLDGAKFLAVGRLQRAHGLHGDITMQVLTDFPERLTPGTLLYVGPQHLPLRLRDLRQYKRGVLAAFEGYDTPEATEPLRNLWVYVRADDRPALPDGEYYHHQLLGLKVVDEEQKFLGIISEILETGANDVYVVSPEFGPDLLLPAIESVVQEIDLETGLMRIHLLPGLLPE